MPLRGGAHAITFGHVIIYRSRTLREAIRKHELIHVRQYERLGPLFIPAYLAASLVALLRGKDPYRDNVFEREAFAASEAPYMPFPEELVAEKNHEGLASSPSPTHKPLS